MIRHIGSQSRERIEDTDYKVDWIADDDSEVILADGDVRELWSLNNSHAGYTLEINGRGYEFVRSL